MQASFVQNTSPAQTGKYHALFACVLILSLLGLALYVFSVVPAEFGFQGVLSSVGGCISLGILILYCVCMM